MDAESAIEQARKQGHKASLPLSWAEGIVDYFAEATGYRLNKRQVRALAILRNARLRIRSSFKFKASEAVVTIRSALEEFLRGAKLKPPYRRWIRASEQPTRPRAKPDPVRRALQAYHHADDWLRAVEAGDASAAGYHAYRVSEFLCYIDYSVMTVYLQRDYENGRRRWLGARANKRRAADTHAEWLRIARDVMRADRYLTSRIEVCRCVAHRAPINPQTGKRYNPDRIYRAIGEQLKNIQK